MSEDSRSDEEWYALADRLPAGANLEDKCWECGKRFQCIESLISHYKSHNVQATCYICQVTFRRMSSLSMHLENAHSPYCNMCNQWFSNVLELNKHTKTHSATWPSFKETHSHGYINLHQDQNSENFDNELTDSKKAPLSLSGDYAPIECSKHVAEDHTYNGSCRNDEATQLLSAESRPLESDEIKHERPETVVEHIHNTVREGEVENLKMDNSYQTNGDECETADDSSSSKDKDLEISLSFSDGDERTSDANEDEDSECVEEQSDTHSEYMKSQSSNDCTEDSDSNSSSSDASHTIEYSNNTTSNPPSGKISMCTECGRGPFKNVKVHLLHCRGKMPKLQCSVCKGYFPTERLVKHQIGLYCCDLCGQIYSHWNSYRRHICPKGNKPGSAFLLYCSESMPKACNMCKAFFSTEQNLLNHTITAHSSRVSTKVCIITKPSALTVKNVSPVLSATEAQLVTSSSGHVLVSSRAVTSQSPGSVNHISGKPSVGQSYAWPLSTVVRSSPSSPSPFSSQTGSVPMTSSVVNGGANKFMILQKTPMTVTHVLPQESTTKAQVTVTTQRNTGSQRPILYSHKMALEQSLSNVQLPTPSSPVRPLAPILMSVPRPGTDHAVDQVTYQPPGGLCTPLSAINKTPATVASHSVSPIMPPPNIVAMFKNDSKEVALKKRMNTSWRSKARYPCRQCGATSRQPSLIVSHRYLHRGRRSHRCQCGRTFLHQLHLLRHCMQHAEATSYICVSCGETLIGAKLLAKHMINSRKSRSSGCTWKHRTMKKCSMPFSCDCGQLFVRPSAYIWHQLKNRAKAKHRKKPSK